MGDKIILSNSKQTVLLDEHNIIFINTENKAQYAEKVLSWLEQDFIDRGCPSNHFFHNENNIEIAFNSGNAMVVLNKQSELIGYMIWRDKVSSLLEIDIAEVKENYRRQNILKKMLAALTDKFTDVHILTGSILPQSELIFSHLGWGKVIMRQLQHNFKIIRSVQGSLNELPDGLAIAVCSQVNVINQTQKIDFHAVCKNKEQYKQQMQYFQLEVNADGVLSKPIITIFDKEGYIGIYFNKKLIAENIARRLFDPEVVFHGMFFCINKINFKNFPSLLHQLIAQSTIVPSAGVNSISIPTINLQASTKNKFNAHTSILLTFLSSPSEELINIKKLNFYAEGLGNLGKRQFLLFCKKLTQCDCLEELYLEGNGLGSLEDFGFRFFCKIIEQLQDLRILDFRGNMLGVHPNKFGVLCETLIKKCNLRVLSFASNDLDDSAMKGLQILQQRRDLILDLKENYIKNLSEFQPRMTITPSTINPTASPLPVVMSSQTPLLAYDFKNLSSSSAGDVSITRGTLSQNSTLRLSSVNTISSVETNDSDEQKSKKIRL